VQGVAAASASSHSLGVAARPKPYGAWYLPTRMWNEQRKSDDSASANRSGIHFATVEQVTAHRR
jgi:hypothetical protein